MTLRSSVSLRERKGCRLRKWTFRVAVFLTLLSVFAFVSFVLLTYYEEEEAVRLGEPNYDSIGSPYLFLVGVAVFAGLGAAIVGGVLLIWRKKRV